MHPLALVIVVAHITGIMALSIGIVTAFAQGKIAVAALEGIARQPEARGAISTSMIIGLGMAETAGIYGLFMSIMIILVNPMISRYYEYLLM